MIDWSKAPEWDKAPEWANYLAVDSDGDCYWFENKPEDNGEEFLDDGKMDYAGHFNKLIERPND